MTFFRWFSVKLLTWIVNYCIVFVCVCVCVVCVCVLCVCVLCEWVSEWVREREREREKEFVNVCDRETAFMNTSNTNRGCGITCCDCGFTCLLYCCQNVLHFRSRCKYMMPHKTFWKVFAPAKKGTKNLDSSGKSISFWKVPWTICRIDLEGLKVSAVVFDG